MEGPTLESAYKAGNFEKNPFVLGTLIIVLLLSTLLRTVNENCKINNKVVSGVYILPQTLLTFLLSWFMKVSIIRNIYHTCISNLLKHT